MCLLQEEEEEAARAERLDRLRALVAPQVEADPDRVLQVREGVGKLLQVWLIASVGTVSGGARPRGAGVADH